MSQEQLSALLQKLSESEELREKMKGAPDLDAAQAIANEAGFAVSATDWVEYRSKRAVELDDSELEQVVGGRNVNIHIDFNLDGTYMCVNSPES